MNAVDRVSYWRERMSEFSASGSTIKGWCRANGARPSQFRYWRKRLAALPADAPAGWMSISTSDEPARDPIRRTLHASGVSLRIGCAAVDIERTFDATVLACVVRVLKEARC